MTDMKKKNKGILPPIFPPINVVLSYSETKKLVLYDLVKDRATAALFEKRMFEGEEIQYIPWSGGFSGDLANIKEEEIIK